MARRRRPDGRVLLERSGRRGSRGCLRVAARGRRRSSRLGDEPIERRRGTEPSASTGGMAWRALVDTHDPDAPERPIAIADRARLRARSCLVLAESATARGGLGAGPPSADQIDALARTIGVASRLVGRQRQAHDRLARDQDRAVVSARTWRREPGASARKPDSRRRRDAPAPAAVVARASLRSAARRPVARRAAGG